MVGVGAVVTDGAGALEGAGAGVAAAGALTVPWLCVCGVDDVLGAVVC